MAKQNFAHRHCRVNGGWHYSMYMCLIIYSGLRPTILLSTTFTRAWRDGQGLANPLASDGATSSLNPSNSWRQHSWWLLMLPLILATGGQPWLLVPSPRPRGKSFSESVGEDDRTQKWRRIVKRPLRLWQ